MNTPLPLSWPVTAVVVLNLCVVAYVLGTNRMTRYQDSRIEWVVGENGRLRTALRMLYNATDYTFPDLAELDDKPERVPNRLLRAWDRLKRAQAPAVMGAQVVAEVDGPITDMAPTEAERQAAAEADGFTPDPSPATNPIVMPEPVGIPTQPDLKQAAQVSPLAALTDEEWEQQQRAQLEAWRKEQQAKWGVVR